MMTASDASMPTIAVNDLKVAQAKAMVTQSIADHRGDLTVLFHSLALAAVGKPFTVRQLLCSRSRENVLRGMHGQARNPQAKIVTCVQGRVLDVVYDCRAGSPTRGFHDLVLLESPEHAVFVPPGCLHGFYALEESVVVYAADQLYDPASDGGVRWDSLGISWPDKSPIVSAKDLSLGSLTAWEAVCKAWATSNS